MSYQDEDDEDLQNFSENSDNQFIVDEDLQQDYKMYDDVIPDDQEEGNEFKENILQKMAFILDKERPQKQKQKPLVDQIEDVKKGRYVEQISKIDGLKTLSDEQQNLIDKQKEEIKQLEQIYMKDDRVHQTLDDQIKYLESQGKVLSDDSKKSISQIQGLSENYDKTKKIYQDGLEKFEQVEGDNTTLRREIDSWIKNLRQLQQDIVKKEQKSGKLLEELTFLKMSAKEETLTVTDHSDDMKKANDKLNLDNKRLQKQRAEIIQVFKKQKKLIEVLRKQKLHLETCSSLQLSEQDFVKAVDLAEKI